MKIGIFGGTFDPIHVGHLRVAEEFVEAYDLDKVLMMVSANPPHRDAPEASSRDRLEMVELAVGDYPRLEASSLELVREGPSYTIDTIKAMEEFTGDEMPWMALGGDAYALIGSWHRPRDVLACSHLVVMTRPGHPVDLMASLPVELRDCYTLDEDVYFHESGATLRTLNVTFIDLSSSMIRQAVSEGISVRDLVTPEVLQFISLRGLYRK